ncbi:class F sortase [Agrococcus carbonis]|uniref:Sortase family protein n=1 Tax=Agrococcus carbonis TaxID=684552 RepID=A0A1H1RRV2_9MICO|nr:class F sortase [Agrococcus carbonis]SDS38394.1 Sortase family protein [Agrococcus carbonis]
MRTDRGLPSRTARRGPSPVAGRRRTVLLALAGTLSAAAVIVGAVLVTQSVAPSLPAGPQTAPAAATPAPTTATPSPSAAQPSGRVPTGVAARDAAPTPAAPVDAPTAVRVPSVDLALEVVPVGVRDDGQMDVPELVGELGWYRYGPAPGADAGSAVLAAHVDSDIGAAPMAAVLGAEAGDPVEVTTASGEVLRFRITSVEQIAKAELPLASLFARDGEHVVRLVTCGGEWDAAAGAYEDNIVVTAEPDAG